MNYPDGRSGPRYNAFALRIREIARARFQARISAEALGTDYYSDEEREFFVELEKQVSGLPDVLPD